MQDPSSCRHFNLAETILAGRQIEVSPILQNRPTLVDRQNDWISAGRQFGGPPKWLDFGGPPKWHQFGRASRGLIFLPFSGPWTHFAKRMLMLSGPMRSRIHNSRKSHPPSGQSLSSLSPNRGFRSAGWYCFLRSIIWAWSQGTGF